MDGKVPMEIFAQHDTGNDTLAKAKQSDTYVIVTMKKLMCKTVLQNRYIYNLQCSANWMVQTGNSSSGDKSKIIKWILPNMLKITTEEELRAFEAPRPDPDLDQSEWRLDIERAAESVENRLKETMQAEELKLKIREESLSGAADTREMYVSAVETRLQIIQKARARISQPSMASIFQSSEESSSSSSGMGIQSGKGSQSGKKSSSNATKAKEMKNGKKKS